MKNHRRKLPLPLIIGMFLYSAALLINRFANIPDDWHLFLLLPGAALGLWGFILLARSPEMKNSRLRQWKLRLIGKEPK